MTSPNHIVGGIAITGISLSFYDINIFENFLYLSICVFASLLPDIDHHKSIIGKIFFPISKYLDKNFGHRTITHSFTFFIPLILLNLFFELNILNPLINKSNYNYTLIFSFGYFSHLILDMLTIQGIPLFYPFMKNPCVIPANPSYRFRSGNLKSEAMAMFLFTMVLVSSYDLFKNGFWTTYNRSFGTITHIDREFKRQIKIIEVSYKYYKFEKLKTGKALVINTNKSSATFFENDKLFTLDKNDHSVRNVELLPTLTKQNFTPKTINFNFIQIDSLNNLLENLILNAEINSNNKFLFNNKINNKIKLKLLNKPYITLIKNDSLINDKKKLAVKIKIIKSKINGINHKINKVNKYNYKEIKTFENLKKNLITIKSKILNEIDLYQKNKLEKSLIELKRKINNYKSNPKTFEDLKINKNNLITELNALEKEFTDNQKQYFNGKISYLQKNLLITNSVSLRSR